MDILAIAITRVMTISFSLRRVRVICVILRRVMRNSHYAHYARITHITHALRYYALRYYANKCVMSCVMRNNKNNRTHPLRTLRIHYAHYAPITQLRTIYYANILRNTKKSLRRVFWGLRITRVLRPRNYYAPRTRNA